MLVISEFWPKIIFMAIFGRKSFIGERIRWKAIHLVNASRRVLIRTDY